MNIMGIDPGAGGGLASLNDDELLVYNMPVLEIKKGKSIRRKIDVRGLANIFQYEKPDHVFVEQVSAQFGNGAAAAFSFGWSCSAIESSLIILNIPFTYVTPQRWKKDMLCPADKDASRFRASQLFPAYAHNWQLKKQDGLAEAAMIALWGKKRNNITNILL